MHSFVISCISGYFNFCNPSTNVFFQVTFFCLGQQHIPTPEMKLHIPLKLYRIIKSLIILYFLLFLLLCIILHAFIMFMEKFGMIFWKFKRITTEHGCLWYIRLFYDTVQSEPLKDHLYFVYTDILYDMTWELRISSSLNSKFCIISLGY